MCPGTLSRIDGAVPGNKGTQNWNQGFGLVHIDRENNKVIPTHVPIYDGVGYYGDMVVEGVDYTEEIESVKEVGFF